MKATYWISTLLLTVFLVLSAASYLGHEGTIVGVRELGFPDFFRLELAVLKLLAAALLALPVVPLQAKEWAYAGVSCFLVTALVAHVAHGDTFAITILLLLLLGLVVVSNVAMRRGGLIGG